MSKQDPPQPTPSHSSQGYSSQDPPIDIAIIGGGLGGLTCAHAFAKVGLSSQVYERASALNEVGAGITLWSNAMRVMDWIGVGDELRRLGCATKGGAIGLADGRLLSRSDELARYLPKDFELIGIHRAALQKALCDSLENRGSSQTVHLGQELVAIREASDCVALEFADHTIVKARLVVAADGIHSVVRSYVRSHFSEGGDSLSVKQDTPRYAGYTCWRGICERPAGWSGTPGEYWGYGDRFGVVEIAAGRMYWFAVKNAAPEQGLDPNSKRLAVDKAELLRDFSHYHHGIPQLIEATPHEAIIHSDIVDRPPARGWSKGRVVLMGDAAHSTTPNMGQGAAMAMESAAILARCLAHDTSPKAYAVYEKLRFDRAAKITKTSWTIGIMAQSESRIVGALRNGLFRWMPKSIQARQLMVMVNYDATRAKLEP